MWWWSPCWDVWTQQYTVLKLNCDLWHSSKSWGQQQYMLPTTVMWLQTMQSSHLDCDPYPYLNPGGSNTTCYTQQWWDHSGCSYPISTVIFILTSIQGAATLRITHNSDVIIVDAVIPFPLWSLSLPQSRGQQQTGTPGPLARHAAVAHLILLA